MSVKSLVLCKPIGPSLGSDITCPMTVAEVRAQLVSLESRRLVVDRRDPDASRTAPRRVYAVTGEGGRMAGISDVRRAT